MLASVKLAPTDQGDPIYAHHSRDLTIIAANHAANRSLPWHAHQHASISAVLTGFIRERARQSVSGCVPGSILIRPPGEPHEDRIGARGARLLVVELRANGESLAPETRATLGRYSFTEKAGLNEVLSGIYMELQKADAFTPLALEGLAMQLVAGASRTLQRAEKQEPAWLRAVRDRILDSVGTHLTLTELAGHAGVHPDHLGRMFRRHYGMSLGQFVRRARVEWVRQRLHSRVPLATLAQQAGFADQSQLTRAFREVVGTTPGRYRAHTA